MKDKDETFEDKVLEPTGTAKEEELVADVAENHEQGTSNGENNEQDETLLDDHEQDPVHLADREQGMTNGVDHDAAHADDHEQVAAHGDGQDVASGDASGLVTLKSRISSLPKLKTTTITAIILGVLGFIANIGDIESFWERQTEGRVAVVEERAIKDTLRGHYEAIGAGDYKKAFSYFGIVERSNAGGEQGWIRERTVFCPVESSKVERNIEAGGIEGDRAIATANVSFDHTCGESDWTFIWNLLKEGDEWKLNSLENAWPNSTSVPEYLKYKNTGETRSDEEIGERLEFVESSATAESAHDTDSKLVTYEPANAVDEDSETAWQVAGDGKGEWISLEYDEPIEVSRVGLIPGYSKIDPADGTDRFYQYYTVREARIELSDGTEKVARFERDPRKQFVEFPKTETDFVKVTILDTYPPGNNPDGSIYKQVHAKTAVSGIEVQGP